MKAILRLPHITIEVEAETQRDLFKECSSLTEVFGEKCCGECGSEDIGFTWRTVKDGSDLFEYPEMVCRQCTSKLTFGINKVGGSMFPNRKLLDNGAPATGKKRGDGKFTRSRGWTKYRGEQERDEPEEKPPQQPAAQRRR